MSTLIKTIPVETRSDTQLSLQIHELKTYLDNEVVSIDNRLCIVTEQNLGLEDDGLLSVILEPNQIDKLIGQLIIAKAEICERDKELQNKK